MHRAKLLAMAITGSVLMSVGSHLTMTPAVARQAAGLAAAHRLRGADAVYVAVAVRYGTVLITRDADIGGSGAVRVIW